MADIVTSNIEDQVFIKFLYRIHKYADSISESDYQFYLGFYEDAQAAVMHKARPFGYTDAQKAATLAEYSGTVVRVSDYLFSKDGSSGEISHTGNGVTRQYKSPDIPDEMLREVVPYCGVVE